MQQLSPIVTAKTNHLLASGLTQGEAAQAVGISRKSANKISQANKVEIEQLALQYIRDSIPLIRSNHIKTLQIAQHVLSLQAKDKAGNIIKDAHGQPMPDIEAIESAKTILTLADKKEYRAMLVMGLVPSNTSSIVVNQLFAGSRNTIDPTVQAALQGYTNDLFDDDVQEAEVEVSS